MPEDFDEEMNDEENEETAEEQEEIDEGMEDEETAETDEEITGKETEKRQADEKGIINTEIAEEVKKSYLDYAMSVIVARALPSVEDGLKPVQRRILYSMNLLGLQSNKQTKKSARIVGDVLGKYHPHGDVAVYDALVRMAQKFSLRYPLVFGQGNFGSVDGDPPAAMRYTEAKMAQISNEMIEDIDKETVRFTPNFDNSLKEPELLPAKIPNLIINGASGIAVGMATNIPPHNLSEICDAIIEYIKNPEISIEQLAEIVTGPDFPTGGVVSGDIVDLYRRGKGRLILRGKVTTEESKGKEKIVITEIPYMLNKSILVEQIAGLIQNKKLIGISDLRDESSKGKIRIVLELKKGTNAKYINNTLYKYTRLQDSFNANFLALIGTQPRVLNLKQIIEEYVKYRKKIITARTEYDLRKSRERLEIVEGLLIALRNLDEIISIIKRSREEAAENLIKKFKFTKRQAEAILETRLRQLTALEQDKLKEENEKLKKDIAEFEKILGDIKEVLKIITKEVRSLKDKYGDERKTQVVKRINEIAEKDLVQKKEVIVSVTEKGYCKRIDLNTYKEQKRGGKGVTGSGLATGDFVKQIITCSTHDYLMFFT
ncbi:MAG: DNA topoisomerase 4 subunit A, partial [Candidatus Pacearchaeota archaeon]|nr:DNA topoisomerase 4 subunit A [Candidatus Pacearchaeota archaeon]